MFLDNFRLQSVIFQITFPSAFEIWDRSGAIARELTGIWPSLASEIAEPNRFSLKTSGVEIRTEIQNCLLILDATGTAEDRTKNIRDVFAIWTKNLNLKEINRVSMRVRYNKKFPNIREASSFILDLGLLKYPSVPKVFDQPIDGQKNSVDISFRFEDDQTFTVLNLKTEAISYKRELVEQFPEDKEFSVERTHVVLDFDKGTLKPLPVARLDVEQWVRGYFHVLRRDLDKVIGS